MKLGSLFDGIGGFPLVGTWYGIEPVWASEIEKEPISITKRHFPNMRHLGDITKVNGAEIEPVDIITFGSPCQDLSVAGKRAGLAGARSGLFGEAIRIIEEMREATNGLYPTWAIWENVPGALSSNDGLDFRAVLQSFANAEIPMPVQGRWADSGMVRGYKHDFGWRTLDAQFWGVPQRRKRIFLVADFRGQRAEQILFKSESLRGHFTPSRQARKGITDDTTNGLRSASGIHQNADGEVRTSDIAYTLNTNSNASGRNAPLVLESEIWPQVSGTLCASGAGLSRPAGQGNELDFCVVAPFDTTQITSKTNRSRVEYGTPCHTLSAHADAPAICIAANTIDRQPKNGGNGLGVQDNTAYTLTAMDRHAVLASGKRATGTLMANAGTKQWLGNQEAFSGDYSIISNNMVRRLTPLECERLQGYPDEWTRYGHDGKEISDSARYKAIGNSLALPCVEFLIQNIVDVCFE